MNPEKARFILTGGLPRDPDAHQEAMREAFRVAERNPEVADWMHRQQQVTDALHHKLNELPVPSGLKDRILAGEAVTRRRSLWSTRSLLAMAAALAVLFGLVATRWIPGGSPYRERSFAGLRTDMGRFLSGYFNLEMHSRQLDKLESYLAEKHQLTGYLVPAALAQNSSVGCRTINWHDTEIALICFSVEGELVHLMVLPREQLPEAPAGLQPAQEGEWATTGWADEDHVYLVATRGDATFLRDVMEGRHRSLEL